MQCSLVLAGGRWFEKLSLFLSYYFFVKAYAPWFDFHRDIRNILDASIENDLDHEVPEVSSRQDRIPAQLIL